MTGAEASLAALAGVQEPRLGKKVKAVMLTAVAAGEMQTIRRTSLAAKTHLIQAFVPDLLLRDLLTAPDPLQAACRPLEAACLCADISGFTALSERHAQEGAAGLDKLVLIINDYYARLVGAVYRHGGDIIKIAGDALYIVFPAEGSLHSAVLSACRCSLELRDVATDALSLHCGISSGELCWGMLGGVDNYWEFLISGEPIKVVATALDEASQRQVSVSSESWDLVQKDVKGMPLESGNLLLEEVIQEVEAEKNSALNLAHSREPMLASMAPLVACFVPAPVLSLVQGGIFDYMAEMRTVTTMFCKLDSYDPVTHRSLLSLQQHLVTAQEILLETEGFLRQFIVDDKGCVLLACWGIPGKSHSDNPARAVAAAVEIQSNLSTQGMQTSVGITTGRALLGRIGGKKRSEYAMVGDVINMAARLMGKAKGGLLCCEVTATEVIRGREENAALFEKLEPMKLKGKEVLVTPYKCLAKEGEEVWLVSMGIKIIGRSEVQRTVNDVMGNLAAEPSQQAVAVLTGSEGCGKTLLLQRFMRNAKAFFKYNVLESKACSSPGGPVALPFVGIERLLWTIFGIDKRESDAFAIRKILLDLVNRTFQNDQESVSSVVLPSLHRVLGIDLSGNSESSILGMVMDPQSQLKKAPRVPLSAMLSTIAEMAAACITVPTVVALEDCHLMDEMSWKLLLVLLKTSMPCMMLLTTHPVDQEVSFQNTLERGTGFTPAGKDQQQSILQQYKTLMRMKTANVFHLGPFTKEEIHELCVGFENDISTDVVDSIASLSGGNPYWCMETVTFIREHGLSYFQSKIGGDVDQNDKCALMDKLDTLVVCRFEQLLVEEQTLLRNASVVGLEFSIALIQGLMSKFASRVEILIQSLVTKRFFQHSRNMYYSFRNATVHQLIYEMVPATKRRELHLSVAQYLEMNEPDNAVYLPIIAHHHIQAKIMPHKVVECCCCAAAYALLCDSKSDCLDSVESCTRFIRAPFEAHEVLRLLKVVLQLAAGNDTKAKPPAPKPDLEESQMRELSHSSSTGDMLGSGLSQDMEEDVGEAPLPTEAAADQNCGSACERPGFMEQRIKKIEAEVLDIHLRVCCIEDCAYRQGVKVHDPPPEPNTPWSCIAIIEEATETDSSIQKLQGKFNVSRAHIRLPSLAMAPGMEIGNIDFASLVSSNQEEEPGQAESFKVKLEPLLPTSAALGSGGEMKEDEEETTFKEKFLQSANRISLALSPGGSKDKPLAPLKGAPAGRRISRSLTLIGNDLLKRKQRLTSEACSIC